EEIIYYDVAYDSINGGIKETFNCPTTGAELKKSDCEKAYFTRFDKVIGQEVRQQKLVPVLINYTFKKKSYSKKPDSNDLGKISNIENQDIPFWFPSYPIPKGEKTGEPIRAGFTHIHHLYFQRTLWSLSAILSKIDIKSTNDIHKLVLLTSSVNRN